VLGSTRKPPAKRAAFLLHNSYEIAVTKQFTHPLARGARVWRAEGLDGSEQSVLVIVTTIELDPKNDRYSGALVEKLSRAANAYLASSSEAAAFVLVHRP
jgi:hypothetical protein